MPTPTLPLVLAIGVNLLGMMIIYSAMASALVRLRWRGHGLMAVIIAILAAEMFWIVPGVIVDQGYLFLLGSDADARMFCLPNSLACLIAIIVLAQAVRRIPLQLKDSARMDGLGWLQTFRQVILPFVGRELTVIALLTLLFNLLVNTSPVLEALFLHLIGTHPQTPLGALLTLLFVSIMMTAFVFGLFLVVKPTLKIPSDDKI
jgi:ABC-type glycerol-3-phosphate transport system permease component